MLALLPGEGAAAPVDALRPVAMVRLDLLPAVRVRASSGVARPGTPWRSAGYPAWYAIDLSTFTGPRRRLLLGWHGRSSSYDLSVRGEAYNLPGDLVVEGHRQQGGEPPGSGWATLASVKGNALSSRTFLFDGAGYGWIRLRATAGWPGNQPMNRDLEGWIELRDASASPTLDAWAFLGDSIVAMTMTHEREREGEGGTTFGERVAAATGHDPSFEAAGIAYDKGSDGPARVDTLLRASAARYVAIAYGMNDASSGEPSDGAFGAALRATAQKVLDAGRIPVIATVPATNDPGHNAALGDPGDAAHPFRINRQIQLLRQAMRAEGKPVLDGPDLWTFFRDHPELMGPGGDVHPRGAGIDAYRAQWARVAAERVYGVR